MMRRQAEAGGTKIRVLIIAVLLVSFLAYQLLIPIDDPSLDGPDNSVTLSANNDQPGEAHLNKSSTEGERHVFWGDLHIDTALTPVSAKSCCISCANLSIPAFCAP